MTSERLALAFAAVFGVLFFVVVVVPSLILIVVWVREAPPLDAIVGVTIIVLFIVAYFPLIHFMESRGFAFRPRK